ncbi:ATP-binding protein [Pedobacter sp. JY14-1]|uniref:sensor histidine kinase n=1 Tax=Pedobacter sp. JY14-1 TaxID=3034151 RepID=UPI0023E1AEF5|nr:ATP-binding protein [Pedobacter sp. JY14-1]
MRLRTKYVLFVTVIHIVLLVLSYFILEKNVVYFILTEVFVIVSVLVSLSLYRQLIEPINQLRKGINAIRDRDFNTRFLPTGKQETDALIEVYNQMMDALREERTKQEAQHFFLEKLIQTSPTGIVILDYDQQLRQVNPKAREILGTETAGFVADVTGLRPGTSRIMRIGGFHTYKVQKSNFIDRGFPRFFIMIEELTNELVQAEKNAYGKVIRMMAHEVNNTVGPVNSIISLALGNKEIWNVPGREALRNALQVAADRNHNLNQFMRNFADLVKLSPVRKQNTDMVALIRSVASFMQVKADSQQTRLLLKLPERPYHVSADSQQMEQVMINIVKNALEAVGEAGEIRILLKPEQHSLSVTDNGKGIPDAISEQLFSPFFSTKRDGQGIGLTLVREILLNHGFDFSLKTKQSGLTEFIINF